ncbi:MAG: recombination protein O N-terminal domain-containing protein [Patescibacteria group bacterium]
MSYHIYTTDGIILKRTMFGEANILLYILTQDLGLIIASARSTRLAVSKLRPALQEYSDVSVSVVHGKNGWKVTNVLEKENFFFSCPEYSHRVLAQVTAVLLKMIQGEDPHPDIFHVVRTGFQFLKSVSEKDIQYFEYLFVLRILYYLGYVVSDSETEVFLKESMVWNVEILQEIIPKKGVLLHIINKALKESQL